MARTADRTELYASKPEWAKDISPDAAAQAAYWNRMDIWPDPIGERDDPAHGNWKSTEPNFKNPSDWVFDNVTGTDLWVRREPIAAGTYAQYKLVQNGSNWQQDLLAQNVAWDGIDHHAPGEFNGVVHPAAVEAEPAVRMRRVEDGIGEPVVAERRVREQMRDPVRDQRPVVDPDTGRSPCVRADAPKRWPGRA